MSVPQPIWQASTNSIGQPLSVAFTDDQYRALATQIALLALQGNAGLDRDGRGVSSLPFASDPARKGGS